MGSCLYFKDGELVAFIAEERLSRLKGDMGYPKLAINRVLECQVEPEEIDIVAFTGHTINIAQTLVKKIALFSTKDWVKEQHLFWKPLIFNKVQKTNFDEYELFKDIRRDVEQDPYASFFKRLKDDSPEAYLASVNEVRVDAVREHLNISKNGFKFFATRIVTKFMVLLRAF